MLLLSLMDATARAPTATRSFLMRKKRALLLLSFPVDAAFPDKSWSPDALSFRVFLQA
jgi:hypothetical protein